MVNPEVGIHPAASLDRVMVEMEGEQVPLRQVGQISMPNPRMLLINMSSYPQVGRQTVWLQSGSSFCTCMMTISGCVCVGSGCCCECSEGCQQTPEPHPRPEHHQGAHSQV